MAFRRPLHEVMSWPSDHVELVEEFLAREPMADARIEIVVARLCELFVRAWGGSAARSIGVKDFLPYLQVWAADDALTDPRYSEVDREVLRQLGRG